MIDGVSMVVPTITEDEVFSRLVARLRRGGVLGVSGLWGSSAPWVLGELFRTNKRSLLYITARLDEADEVVDDLATLTNQSASLLPAWETLPGEGSAHGEIHGERLRLCAKLRSEQPALIVAPIQALIQPVPKPAVLEHNTLRLRCGQRRDSESVVQWLVDRGFERLDRVESPGDFAQRGDIIDVFAPGREDPVRLEFFDDVLEAAREFDVSTQRSVRSVDGLTMAAMPSDRPLDPRDADSFLSYLATDAIIVLDRPGDVQEAGDTIWRRLDRHEKLIPPQDLLRTVNGFTQVHISRVGTAVGAAEDVFHFGVQSLARFEGKTDEALQSVHDAAQDHDVIVFCQNDGESQRLGELIEERCGSLPDAVTLAIGVLHRGFEWVPTKTIVVAHHEIFHRAPGRRLRRRHASRPLESVLELCPGDLVVHVIHGIAKFRGMQTMRKGSSKKSVEFMTLEFADRATVHVPTSQIGLIQKYIGAAGVKPALSKLGGVRWKNTKDKVNDAVSELAESLLRVQAERRDHEGIRYPADTTWQKEFESSFMYEDTEDQVIVAREIKDDLRRERPMDRLLCGDVGYGKTELAIRAAFKVVEYGRQVAVLVPTTVLAEQHYRTFSQRLAEYPFHVGCLSRFRSTQEQRKLIERAKKGQVDILIGTHRLLSKDVGFADLGLVVIDEEQRFGVEHKERLKQMRATVDLLTLSATPIPRTLHMALVGLRDISSLQSPPMDRRSIASHVMPFDESQIRAGIVRELNRDGQVYFVHNIVRSIKSMGDQIARLVPEARILIGHGQMKEGELEKVMDAFLNRKADVLVATTIIESGIDIPNVNTIFINNADRFGLADLHQLRGRVGRSAARGYCYFLLPPSRPVTDKAEKRLKAIEEFSDLGAGFRIAMRDLEIRGAGNLLGPEQSGHIAAVGYEMYCELLEAAVRRLQGKPPARPPAVHLELEMPVHIPKSYIADERMRIDIYRRLAACATTDDVERLDRDLKDAFGKYPSPVAQLIECAELRTLAATWGITSIVLDGRDLVFTFSSLADVQDVFTDAPGSVRSPDPKTVHLRLGENYFEPATLIATLRRMMSRRRTREAARA